MMALQLKNHSLELPLKKLKFLIKKMSSIGFEITIDTGTEIFDFSLDLPLNTYCPYGKPNS